MLNAERRSLPFLLVLCVVFLSLARATELKQPTADAFEHYVQRTELRIQDELSDSEHFLYFDSLPEQEKASMLARLQGGHVVIEPMRTRDQAVALAQDYPRHPELYAPDVQRATVLSHVDQHFSLYFRFYRHAIVTAVYNTEFSADYFLPDNARGYCFARAVRIAEVQNPGKPDERELPVGNDHGYMWRLNLYSRYMERDNGVYIEIEFLALSRSVPAIFAWFVNPYIRSVPRDYLTNYMHVTKKALSPDNAHS